MTRLSAIHASLPLLLSNIRQKAISKEDFWKICRSSSRNTRVITVNLEILRDLCLDQTHLDKSDFCLLDSGVLSSAIRKIYGDAPPRYTGREIVAHIRHELRQETILIFGASERSRMKAARILRKDFPASIYGFSEPDDLRIIPARAARCLAVFAYGYPKQEDKIEQFLAAEHPVFATMVGVGGAIDYLAGTVPPPPSFLTQRGMEWIWRLLIQPHHRLARIASIIPLALDLLLLSVRANQNNHA